jgi:hypothetical protein
MKLSEILEDFINKLNQFEIEHHDDSLPEFIRIFWNETAIYLIETEDKS